MFMCNVYTLVSTNPKKLNTAAPIVREASLAMRVIRRRCEEAVAGWGNQITLVRGWEDRVDRLKRDLEPLHCLGVTKLGHPRHPLYLPRTAQRIVLES